MSERSNRQKIPSTTHLEAFSDGVIASPRPTLIFEAPNLPKRIEEAFQSFMRRQRHFEQILYCGVSGK